MIIGDFGEAVVLDWGLAKLLSRSQDEEHASAVVIDEVGADSGYTIPGQALGTPAYMAPEQADGRLDVIDQRTDVYGLGAILYEILTGASPFAGNSTQEVLRKVREEAPAAPRQLWADVPAVLEAVCLRALAKHPADRPPAAAELALAVQGWQEFERRKAEEALRESEALYHSLVECLPCCVVRKDLDGRFTFANQKFCADIGIPLEEFVGKTDFDFFPREFAEKYRRDDRAVLDSGQVLDIVEEHVTTKGERFYVQVMKTPLFDPDGKPIGIQGIFWDVTERRREEELRKSRERFELAVQGSQDGLWDWDLVTNQVWWSPRMRDMFGYDEHELSMRPDELERVNPDDHERWRAAQRITSRVWLIISSWNIVCFAKMVAIDGFAPGVWHFATPTAKRIAWPAHSKTSRHANSPSKSWPASATCLTRSWIICRTRFTSKTQPAVSCASTRRQLICSASTTLRRSSARPILTSSRNRTPSAPRRTTRKSCGTGTPLVEEDEKITWPGGREGWLSTTKMPLRDQDGTTIGVFGVFRDISRRKQAEIALQESEHRYRSVIGAMQDGILVLDADGRIRACNASAQRILGLSVEESRTGALLEPQWCAFREDGSPFPAEACPQ